MTAETAETLIAADMDVENRSAAIRYHARLASVLLCWSHHSFCRALRSQIEEERKAQEALLKKMKIADDRGGNGHSTHQGNATNTSRSAGATQRDRRR